MVVCLTFSSERHVSVKLRLHVQRNSEILQKYLLNGISKMCFFGILRKLNSSGGKWRVYCKLFLLMCSCFLRLNILFYFQKLQDEMRAVLKTFSIELTDDQVQISYVFLSQQRNNPSLFHAIGGVAFFYPLSLKCMTHTHNTYT